MCDNECRIYCSSPEGDLDDLRITLFRMDDSGFRHLCTRELSSGDGYVSFPGMIAGRYLVSIERIFSNGSVCEAEQEIVIDRCQRLAMV
ncbi:MAG: hypothetical protein MJZ38_00820 [archaeon]|nr:hypothetical protein [archaeon]